METTPKIDPRHFRATMGRFATGVTVVTVGHGEHPHGMTANAFMSISLDPPLVLVSVDQRARMNQHLGMDLRYGVNVLSEQQEAIGRHLDRKSTRLNSSHANISYAVFCLKKKKK